MKFVWTTLAIVGAIVLVALLGGALFSFLTTPKAYPSVEKARSYAYRRAETCFGNGKKCYNYSSHSDGVNRQLTQGETELCAHSIELVMEEKRTNGTLIFYFRCSVSDDAQVETIVGFSPVPEGYHFEVGMPMTRI